LTQFEFFAVAVSIILALGMSRLLDGVLPSLQSFRHYWVHFLWVIQKLINHIMWWWGTWAANSFEWNLAWFFWSLAGPIVLYLQATALVTTAPNDIESWEEHFFSIRRWFFAGNIALCVVLLLGRFATPINVLPSVTIGLIALASIAVIGITTDNRRVHGFLVVLALSIQVLGLGASMFNAGAY
jgi:hypothetical protein